MAFTRPLGKKNINPYRDKNTFRRVLIKYLAAIKHKHVAVVGTENPWAKAIVLNLGADKVTTVEYRNIIIDHPRVITITPFDYASTFFNRTADTFDAVISYSSLEHTGLGRYGDPLMPYGDMKAVAQIWCTMKPGGYLFLAVPFNKKTQSVFYDGMQPDTIVIIACNISQPIFNYWRRSRKLMDFIMCMYFKSWNYNI